MKQNINFENVKLGEDFYIEDRHYVKVSAMRTDDSTMAFFENDDKVDVDRKLLFKDLKVGDKFSVGNHKSSIIFTKINGRNSEWVCMEDNKLYTCSDNAEVYLR